MGSSHSSGHCSEACCIKQCRIRKGFTLVEILLVVVILGILAAIVVPQFSSAALDSANTAFATSLRGFVDAAMIYQVKTGRYPDNSASGICPTGLEAYIEQAKWERMTPLGGMWDLELNSFGYTLLIGVHFISGLSKDDLYMTQVDALFDDGNLDTGCFRKIAIDRYYYIICN
ncbi:MAG: prepilin-type N-terminal cleavage/methylation domain-containing protein [Phycisphaerae bacterium]|nr:prepilin-type N-terminal cleavage/methylation domain-containing protein [Phycisphaerae bacterium]